MKKAMKILGILIGVVIIVAIGGILYINSSYPDVGEAPDLSVDITPERLARGEYLATHVSVCMDCHSERDWGLFAGPPTDDNYGGGGEVFDEKMGFPGSFVAPNITPAALSSWTDGEIYRAITSGVSKDGRALFPIMPWPAIGRMDTEDVYSIIAYVRSLEPVAKENPASTADFPMSMIMKMMPSAPSPGTRPPATERLAYGKYMAEAAFCQDCHTPMEKGKRLEGLEYAGGMEFHFPGGAVIRSLNITPDKETGIGNWTEDMFVRKFKSYVDSTYEHAPIAMGEFNTPMPWTMYGDMTEEDLSAIYGYLMSLKPVSNTVQRYSPPAK